MRDIILENLANTREFCVSSASFALYSCGMSINQRIKQKRLECGYPSHKALADAVGVSWQTVQLWEKEGGTAPNRSRMPKVAAALKTTPEYLLHGEGDGSARTAPESSAGRGMPTLQWVSEDEAALLSAYRAKTESGKNSLRVMLEALPDADVSGIDHKSK